MLLIVNLPGYEKITVKINKDGDIESYQLCASSQTLNLFKQFIHSHGQRINQWPLPNIMDVESSNFKAETRRAHLLLQELILKARGIWKLPYSGEMVCTCRAVSSEVINNAITAKANTLEDVSNWTTASTSCTTCKDKVEELITYRLLNSTKIKSVG